MACRLVCAIVFPNGSHVFFRGVEFELNLHFRLNQAGLAGLAGWLALIEMVVWSGWSRFAIVFAFGCKHASQKRNLKLNLLLPLNPSWDGWTSWLAGPD